MATRRWRVALAGVIAVGAIVACDPTPVPDDCAGVTTTAGGGGTTTTSTPPVGTGPAAIVTGAQHSCYLRGDGSIRCWGANSFGQLGNGTNTSSTSPQTVVGINDATAIAAGNYHTCALRAP